MIFLGITVAFIIFSIVVLVHEYGHFKAARIFGIKVEEFGLGIPPRAKKLWKDTHGTLFSLNWLPLGGFVKIAGETPNMFLVYNKKKKLSEKEIILRSKNNKKLYDKNIKEIPSRDVAIILEKIQENSADYNLSNKPAWQQIIVILAGVFMNFVLATLIFAGLFFFGVRPIGINDTIPIKTTLQLLPTFEQAQEIGIIEKNPGIYISPLEKSSAEQAGIKNNDLLLRVNNEHISGISHIQNIIQKNAGKELAFYIQRVEACPEDGPQPEVCPIIEYTQLYIPVSSNGTIGAYLSENISVNQDFVYKYSFIESLGYGFLETYGHIQLTFKALGVLGKNIFFPETPTDRKDAVNQLSGPIGIVDFISDSLGGGIVFLIIIGAIISINLGVFNLLPIPALDGGRFIFIVLNSSLQKLTGKRGISHRIEASIHVIFFLLLIALSIGIAYNDIVKIFSQ